MQLHREVYPSAEELISPQTLLPTQTTMCPPGSVQTCRFGPDTEGEHRDFYALGTQVSAPLPPQPRTGQVLPEHLPRPACVYYGQRYCGEYSQAQWRFWHQPPAQPTAPVDDLPTTGPGQDLAHTLKSQRASEAIVVARSKDPALVAACQFRLKISCWSLPIKGERLNGLREVSD